jgi:hypothetical protein
VGSIRLPGGTEIRAYQTPPSEWDEESLPEDEDIDEIEDIDQLVQLREIAEQQHRLARLWFYRYLSVFLVPMTQSVLRWFAQSGGVTQQVYDEAWKAIIPDNQQRAFTLSVLLRNDLVVDSGGLIRVTDHGHRFLLFQAGQEEEALEPPTQPDQPPA